ncbi:coiled-coil domain-containing protein 181 isoform X1 [Hypanus sabinus]|uniref:coiled-coil domain-containing protein 181 isoform X1 n=1 Tax=Hypanus sabinus TaxID=79690 RepID=UPI0028C42E05|nr:coiled-coil domain-containing protein 181 isoform X1 [Hypanus sabinus]XP_059824305.1 coiled-coil domain-containing protein 181 isoform X1 [Hypanus sabinus]XP_059824306.1 coiled-coil domain-containing protein 181 isoform X1 [Hypanus sabinus]
MSEENSISSQVEEYEDDFEKDLDWLINEETKNSDEDPEDFEEDENIEAKIDKELDDNEEAARESTDDEKHSGNEVEQSCELNEDSHNDMEKANEGENVTTITFAPISEAVSESSFQELKQEEQQDKEQNEEVKRYIMEKIEQANKELKDEDPVDQNRERRLKFKDNLVDLVVPPAEFAEIERDNEEITGPKSINYISNDVQKDNEEEVIDKMSQMHISNDAQKDNNEELIDKMSEMHIPDDAHKGDTGKQWDEDKNKDKEVLMVKDGKFELLSLQDFESQGTLPQICIDFSENAWEQLENFKGKNLSSIQNSLSPFPTEILNTLKPKDERKAEVTSSSNAQKNRTKKSLSRRVQSATVFSKQSADVITPEHKELNWRTQQKKMQSKTEASKTDEEERKKEENKIAFGIWLQKKKQQHQKEKRIQCAKEIEKKNSKEFRDPSEAFNLWLKKKREQQIKEQQIEAMRKREQDYNSKIYTREDSEKAFKQWLKRKKAEKRAEQLAAKERCRKFLLEARRVKRMQTLLCSLNESKSFHFDNYGYRF